MIVAPTLVDMLMVTGELDAGEVEQIMATHGRYAPQDIAADLYTRPGEKFAFIADGQAQAIGGWDVASAGVMQSWMLVRAGAWEKYGRALTKDARRVTNDVFALPAVHRLQTHCLASRERARRWYGALGLEFESITRRYGINGEDFAMFSRIK